MSEQEKFEDLPEIKGTILEPYNPAIETEGNWLSRMMSKLEAMLRKETEAKREKAWLQTDEGKAWQRRENERLEMRKNEMARTEAAYEELTLECKRQLALTLEADLLIKKWKIAKDDPRLEPIRSQLIEMRMIMAAAHYKQG